MSNNELDPRTEQQLHELYQSLEKEQPPHDIDQQILSAAHDAVASDKVTPLKPRHRSWYMPVSVAAVIVISFSVVLKLELGHEVLSPATDSQRMESIQESEISISSGQQSIIAGDSDAVSDQFLPDQEHNDFAQGLAQPRSFTLDKAKKQSMATQSVKQAEDAISPMASKLLSPAPQGISASVERRAAEPTAARTVEQHIRYMQQLLNDEHYDELKSEMLIFRRDNPDYDLPAALRAWEKQTLSGDAD